MQCSDSYHQCKRSHPTSINKSPEEIDKTHTKSIPMPGKAQRREQRKDTEALDRVDETSDHGESEGAANSCIVAKTKTQENFFPAPPIFNLSSFKKK